MMQGTDQEKMADQVIETSIAWLQNRRMVTAELKRLHTKAQHTVGSHHKVQTVGLTTILLGDMVAVSGLVSLLLSWRPACYVIPLGTIMSLIGTLMVDHSKKECRREMVEKIGRSALKEHSIDNNRLSEALDALRHFRSCAIGPQLDDPSNILHIEGHISAANRDTTFNGWRRYMEDYLNQLHNEAQSSPVSILYLKLICTAILLVTCSGIGWYQHAGLLSKGVMILFVGVLIPVDVWDRLLMQPRDKQLGLESHISQAIENMEKHLPSEASLLGDDEGYDDI